MNNPLSQLKDQIDRQIAQVQSDIGQFLMQKTRILNMPDSLTRSSLLGTQTNLEKRATDAIAQANDLRAKVPDHFDPFNFNQIKAVPGLVREAGNIGKNLLSLKKDMGNHVSNVDAQAGPSNSPLNTPAALSQNSNNLLAWGALAVAAIWVLKKRKV